MRLEKLDARVKLVMMLSISTVSVLSKSVVPLLAMIALLFIVLVVGRADVISALYRIRGMLKLLLTLFILQCIFTRSGEPWLQIGTFTLVTVQGINNAAVVVLRLFVIVLSAIIVLTGQTRDYLLAMNQWHVPYEISFMVMVAMRFLPILRQEASDVLCAIQMRGTKIKGTSAVNKLKVYSSLMLPVLSGALRRCEEMSIAMEARAFRAMPTRTSMRRIKMTKADWIYGTVLEIIVAAILALSIHLRWGR